MYLESYKESTKENNGWTLLFKINVLFETNAKSLYTSMTYVSSLKCVHSLGPK